MDNATIARSYATALFELAERKKEVESISRAFASINALFASNRRIGEFLSSPKIEVGAKKQALRVTFEGRVPPIFLNFLLVVLDKRRQRLLRDIAREYDLLMDENLGRVNVAESNQMAHGIMSLDTMNLDLGASSFEARRSGWRSLRRVRRR